MRSEREKKVLLMRISVITIIVLIFFLWAYNIKYLWKPIVLNNNENQNKISELSQFEQDVNKQMTEINKKLNDVVDRKQEAKNKAGDDLLNNIIRDAKQATSSLINDLASTSPSSTPNIKNSNCPSYINCMPTIGESRPCQIPVGCEGITTIAY
ncbi:MAG: ATP synthase subunit B family protein [Patescibacteria group bacterium]